MSALEAETLEVLSGGRPWWCQQGDALTFLDALPAGCADLCFFSPPYEQARLYLEGGVDLGVARDTEAWAAWILQVFRACLRVCKGLVACVCEGQTKGYRYSGGPVLLWADLIRQGVVTRKAPIYRRVGIPGSGGPDWLRNDYEFVICATNGGKLPWSDNTACGHPPKWAPGGEMSNRLASGARVNQWGHSFDSGGTGGGSEDVTCQPPRPSHRLAKPHTKRRAGAEGARGKSFDQPNGTTEDQTYVPPVLANPGNVIECKVGGGLIGNALAHENEAPFPESLAEFFARSFCPPGGLVLGPFSGSGTTAAVSYRLRRRALACDLRPSQVELSRKRIAAESPLLCGYGEGAAEENAP